MTLRTALSTVVILVAFTTPATAATRYATVPYTTTELIAWPDGNDELITCVPH